MAEQIPDEVMRKAQRLDAALAYESDPSKRSEAIARALMARDKRGAEIARDRHEFWHANPSKHQVRCDVTACDEIATAILTYGADNDQ